MVTWRDNFDSFYSEVAELGRYSRKPKTFSAQIPGENEGLRP